MDTDVSDRLLVLVTAPEGPAAEALARALVEAGLAACVNRLPGIRSTYRWEGQVQEDVEALLIVKTTTGAWPALERRVRELHPYATPEVIALPLAAGSPPYLAWWAESVREGRQP